MNLFTLIGLTARLALHIWNVFWVGLVLTCIVGISYVLILASNTPWLRPRVWWSILAKRMYPRDDRLESVDLTNINVTSSRFLSLSPELRHMVYELVFAGQIVSAVRATAIQNDTERYLIDAGPEPMILYHRRHAFALRLACVQIARETNSYLLRTLRAETIMAGLYNRPAKTVKEVTSFLRTFEGRLGSIRELAIGVQELDVFERWESKWVEPWFNVGAGIWTCPSLFAALCLWMPRHRLWPRKSRQVRTLTVYDEYSHGSSHKP
jgi:hypothetical protein